ncbi:MAG: glycosyl transferase family 2 [Blastopirellula sp.]|nr:MAG: glycosyl transferase family 2 [Blastopirellula sp.]
MTHKVTIGLPVYNGEAFIKESLDSLLAQTYSDFELIISDNASTDHTEAICREYAANDSRISYHRVDENLGAVPNFNRVFELSNSQYFKWAAADDVCAPNFLARCVDILDNNPSVVWCHSRSTHIDAKGNELSDVDAVNVSYAARQASKSHERFRAVLLGAGGCLDTYGLIRSEVIRKTPLFLPFYGAEKVFIAELALRGQYQEINEILFYPRVHSGGAGNLQTEVEQQAYMSTRSGSYKFPRLQMLKGYLQAILRSDISVKEKSQCLLVISRYLLQVEKWKRILVRTLSGAGIKGGNVDRIQQLEKQNPLS